MTALSILSSSFLSVKLKPIMFGAFEEVSIFLHLENTVFIDASFFYHRAIISHQNFDNEFLTLCMTPTDSPCRKVAEVIVMIVLRG